MTEDINVQFRPPIISYKFFHKTEFRMFDVDMMYFGKAGSVDTVFVKKNLGNSEFIIVAYNADAGYVIPSTEVYSDDYCELFLGDLVNWKHEGQNLLRMVFWDNGWRVMNCTTDEFENEAKNMTVLGNRFEQEELYQIYLKQLNGKKS